jgi:hypothetical protein
MGWGSALSKQRKVMTEMLSVRVEFLKCCPNKTQVGLAFAFFFLLLQFHCRSSGEKSIIELYRMLSPDSLVTVIVTRNIGGGATGDGLIELFLVPTGHEIEDFDTYYVVLSNSGRLQLKWIESDVLEIHYDRSQIFKFRSIFQSKHLNNWHHVVELRLIKDGNYKLNFEDT